MPPKGWRKPEQGYKPKFPIQIGRDYFGSNVFLGGLGMRTASGRRTCVIPSKPISQRKKLRSQVLMMVTTEIERKGVNELPEEEAIKVLRLPERVAAIVGKTFAEMGDGAELADDEALGMVRDLLIDIDPNLIERNKKKRLARARGRG